MSMREKEIRDRVEALGWKVVKSDTREVKTELTEDQMAAMAKDIDEHLKKYGELENEKKRVDKVLKDQMDDHESIYMALSKVRRDGFENRETEVLIVADVQGKVRRVFSLVSGLQVATEMLQDSDLQEDLGIKVAPAKKEKKAEKPAPAPGPLEIGYESPKSESGEVVVEGVEIVEGDYEVLGQMEDATQIKPEQRELVTQIRSVEKKDGMFFITTAENEIFFTDKVGDSETAKYNIETNKNQVQMGTGVSAYVKISYLESNTRNKQLVEIEDREVVTSGTDVDAPLPAGIEEGDDPDAGGTISNDPEVQEVDEDDDMAPE